MIVLGVNGQFDLPGRPHISHLPPWFFHDAAAAILVDGELVCAVEEERLTRIKHTNTFPVHAVRACLDVAGVPLAAVDEVAFFFAEEYTDKELFHQYVEKPGVPLRSARSLVHERFREVDPAGVAPHRLRFVEHHPAHAASVYADAGMPDALVVVMDGNGENDSMTVYSAESGTLVALDRRPTADSIGHLYTRGTELLGYRLFDEYKVMGLAPLGDPARYRDVLRSLYELRPDGGFTVDSDRLRTTMFRAGFVPRRNGEPFTGQHRDLAAALQETAERLATHCILHWQRETGHRHLAVAGGVGQNSTLNGRLLRSGHFSDVFVHPAAHDSGAAYGAAVLAAADGGPIKSVRRRHVHLGPPLADPADVTALLDAWGDLVRYERHPDITEVTADLLAEGKVVGWVQGRSEFGPRALGHRSILADPRPVENKDRVNHMIKQREGYRPFAPSVQAEHLRVYFDMTPGAHDPDFMVFTVPVREEFRPLLGAITHVDGTARVHAVDRVVDERFWSLLGAFGRRTGVPMLLNTSFNNHAEPIVDSAADALACFLTTGLDRLVIGDHLVTRRESEVRLPSSFVAELMPAVHLETVHGADGPVHHVVLPHMHRRRRSVSARAHPVLCRLDGRARLDELGVPASSPLLAELHTLWQERFIRVAPAPSPSDRRGA
ncbi:carbamoyltransferase [Micromonospora sp. NPDC050187]|uniref:carbamoyltransferase n=1 Tax=Micromonospora sp. NPDC050187 TaxID=3364277 RepID=UPI00379232C0